MSFLVLLAALGLATVVALAAAGFHWLAGHWDKETVELSDDEVEAASRPLSNVRVIQPREPELRL